jgi:hypothetical protein
MPSDDTQAQRYPGLPAAATVEQAIVLAQLLIMRDLERKAAQAIAAQQEHPAQIKEAA